MKIYYHTEGERAFLIEEDGSTLCEIVAPGNNSSVAVAVELVQMTQQVKDIAVRSAADIRKEALGLLEKAQGIDGLKPFVVMHEHAYGTSGYMCWSNSEDPSRDEASSVLDSEFEEDREETLTVQSIDLNELTGVAPSSHGVDPKKEQEKAMGIVSEKESFTLADAAVDQSYSGKVMGLTELHVVLSLGRTAVIIAQVDIDEVPSMDDDVVVKFAGGKGVVEFVKGKEVEQGR